MNCLLLFVLHLVSPFHYNTAIIAIGMLNSGGIREKSRDHTIYLFVFSIPYIPLRVVSKYLRVHYGGGGTRHSSLFLTP